MFCLLTPASGFGQENPSWTRLLQEGLFEEEANRDYQTALEKYRQIVSASKEQRRIVATALFRVAECQRKLNDDTSAIENYRLLIRDFSDQVELVEVARQRLAGLDIQMVELKNSPALLTAEAEVLERLKQLKQHSPDLLSAPNSDGQYPIHEAASNGYLSVAQYLIENKVDLAASAKGYTPLCSAINAGHNSMVKLLIDAGVDVNQPGSNGVHPLYLATYRKYQTIIETLLEAGGDVNGRGGSGSVFSPSTFVHRGDSHKNSTALQLAVAIGDEDLVQFLLDRHADIHARNGIQATVMHYAAAGNHTRILNWLVARGANVNVQTTNGSSPLFLALNSGTGKEAFEFLLEHGADPNISVEGRPLLFYAADNQDSAYLDLLLKHNAEISVRNADGWSLLHNTVTNWKVEHTRLLLELGMDPNILDAHGKTPLDYMLEFEQRNPNLPPPPIRGSSTRARAIPARTVRGSVNVNVATNNQPGGLQVFKLKDLLLQHGASPYYGRQSYIGFIHGNSEQPRPHWEWAVWKDNPFDLSDLVCDLLMKDQLPFPDFSRMTLERLSEDQKQILEIPFNLLDWYEKNEKPAPFPLQWGDVLRIPERVHGLNESWEGITQEWAEYLSESLVRKVTLRTRDLEKTVTLSPAFRNVEGNKRILRSGTVAHLAPITVAAPDSHAMNQLPSLKSFLYLPGHLYSTSDLSSIEVIRSNARGESRIYTFNLKDPEDQRNSEIFILQDGDIVQVPDLSEKTTGPE